MTYIRSSRLYQLYVVLLSRPFFRSRDRDRVLDKMNSSLEIMVSRLQQFLILVTEHSLEVATKYSNRATGDGRHQACCLEIKTYRYSRSWAIRSRDRPRPRPGQNELECTRVSRPWSRDHNTGYMLHPQQKGRVSLIRFSGWKNERRLETLVTTEYFHVHRFMYWNWN